MATRYLIVNTRGGLANRLRVLVSALQEAKIGNRKLIVIWPLDAALNAKLEDLFNHSLESEVQLVYGPSGFITLFNPLNIKGLIRIGMNLPSLSLNKVMLLYQYMTLPQKYILSAQELDNNYSAIIEKQPLMPVSHYDLEFIRKLSSWFELSRDAPILFLDTCYRLNENASYYNHLPLTNELKMMNPFKEQDLIKMVGLHIRGTDHSQAKGAFNLNNLIDKIKKENWLNPDTKFYLATDEPDLAYHLKVLFPGKIYEQSKSSLDRNNKQAIKEAVIDFYNLSKTKKIIGSYYSSFSQEAAILGRIQIGCL